MKITLDEIKKLIDEGLMELQQPTLPTLSAPPAEETLSKKIYKTFSDFNYKLNNYENQLTRFYQTQLNKDLQGKTVLISASIGYGQVKKEYTIVVKEVKIIFYYKEYVVALIGRSQGDRKDREYILDDSFDVKIAAPKTKPVEVPEEEPEVPKISSPSPQKPINPSTTQSKGPAAAISSGGQNAPVQSQPKV